MMTAVTKQRPLDCKEVVLRHRICELHANNISSDMKKIILFSLTVFPACVFAQGLEGTWQQTGSKTCFQANMKESDTEKELKEAMHGSSATSVAKIIVFKKDGSGQESIFSAGRKKGSELSAFKYKWNTKELLFIDKKSGIITSRFVVDEITTTTLKIHDAVKECETRSFIKVK
jgi:hypothetical protein